MASKRSRTVGTTSNTIVHVGAIDQETYGGDSNDDENPGDNILIDVGGGMLLELGMNHWDQQQWLNVGFKGERAAWAASVGRVTLKLSVKTDDKASEYGPYDLVGMDIGQSFAFNPTSTKWSDRAMGRRYPGFAIPVPGGYQGVAINVRWKVEAIIELEA